MIGIGDVVRIVLIRIDLESAHAGKRRETRSEAHWFGCVEERTISRSCRFSLRSDSPSTLCRSSSESHEFVDRFDVSDSDGRSSFENRTGSVNVELVLRSSDEVLRGRSDRIVMSRESDRSESDEDDDSNESVPFSKC